MTLPINRTKKFGFIKLPTRIHQVVSIQANHSVFDSLTLKFWIPKTINNFMARTLRFSIWELRLCLLENCV